MIWQNTRNSCNSRSKKRNKTKSRKIKRKKHKKYNKKFALFSSAVKRLSMLKNVIHDNSFIEKQIKWASWASVFVSIFVLTFKTLAYLQTQSQAIFSDALESIVNVVASIAALWIVHESTQPADDQHPYGHGKLEYFSAAFEGGLICFAAIMIMGKSVYSILSNQSLENFASGFYLSIVASSFNLFLGLYLKYIGKKYHSTALSSSGAHVLSDIWTTAGSLGGLGLVWMTGLLWIDAAAAILMAFYLLYAGYKVVRVAFGGLLDEYDEGSLQYLASSLEKNRIPGIIDIHQTRMIRAGRFHHIDAHLVIPEFWDVSEAHRKTNSFEEEVVTHYPLEGEIAFHLDPCLKSYCSQCDLETCPIRVQKFVKREAFTPKSLVKKPFVPGNPSKTENQYHA